MKGFSTTTQAAFDSNASSILDIVPGRGLGPILLGMQPAEVSELMNEPQLHEDWMGGNLNGFLCYRGLLFEFDDCDQSNPLQGSRLTEITVHSRSSVEVCGMPWKSWQIDDLVNALKNAGYDAFRWANKIEVRGKLTMWYDKNGVPVFASISNFPAPTKGRPRKLQHPD